MYIEKSLGESASWVDEDKEEVENENAIDATAPF